MAQIVKMGGLLGSRAMLSLRWHCPSKLSLRCFGIPSLYFRLPPSNHSAGFSYNFRSPFQSSFKYSRLDPSSPFDAVLLSAKECADGSIMFKFGSPDQYVSRNLTDAATTKDVNGSVSGGDAQSFEHSSNETEQASRTTSSGTAGVSPADGIAKVADDSTLLHHNETEADLNVVARKEENQEKANKERNALEPVITDSPNDLKKGAGVEEKLQIDRAHRFLSGAEMCPHPEKAATGGEDAYFIEGVYWVGVADGVGGWALEGVDSGYYSRELMSNCALLVQQEHGIPNPKRVLIESAKKTTAIGTCTALVAALYNQTLYAVNVGDTGFLVIRDGRVVTKSTSMQRAFNFPYQIGTGGDNPHIAEMYEVSVYKGDVVVLGTDGLYDNVYELQIVNIIQSALQQQNKPQEAAAALVRLAHKVGAATEGPSPFSDAAVAAGYSYTGGKQDDVTVVVAYVQ